MDFLSAVDNTEWVTDLWSFFQTFPSVPYILQTQWELLFWDQSDTRQSWSRKERSDDHCNYVEGECVLVHYVGLVSRACLWLCLFGVCVCVCWTAVGRDAHTDSLGTDVCTDLIGLSSLNWRGCTMSPQYRVLLLFIGLTFEQLLKTFQIQTLLRTWQLHFFFFFH